MKNTKSRWSQKLVLLGLLTFLVVPFPSVADRSESPAESLALQAEGRSNLQLAAQRVTNSSQLRPGTIDQSVILNIGADGDGLLELEVRLKPYGRASYVSGVLTLKNRKNQSFSLKLKYPRRIKAGGQAGKGRIYEPKVNARSSIRARSTSRLRFGFALEGNGKYLAPMQLEISDRSGEHLGSQPVYLYFRVQNRRYRHLSYRELYLADAGPLPAQKLPARARVIPNPRQPVFDFESESQLPDSLPLKNRKIKVADYPSRYTGLTAQGVGKLRQEFSSGDKSLLSGRWNVFEWFPDFLSIPEARAYQPSSYSVKGKFSYIGIDNKSHPAWGWTVELIWRNKHKLASGLVKYDGRYFLSFKHKDTLEMAPGGYDRADLTVNFVMKNDFVSFQPSSHLSIPNYLRVRDPYTWAKEFGYKKIVGKGGSLQFLLEEDLDVGHLGADTSLNGERAGLGDAFYSAMNYWNKLLTNGINPTRPQPIDVIVPSPSPYEVSLFSVNADEKDWQLVTFHEQGATLNFTDDVCWGDPNDPPLTCLLEEEMEERFAVFIGEEALLETVGLTFPSLWIGYVSPPARDVIVQGLALNTYLKFSENQFHPSDKTLIEDLLMETVGMGEESTDIEVRILKDCLSPGSAMISGFLRAVDFWVRPGSDIGVPNYPITKLAFIEDPFPEAYPRKHCFSKNYPLVKQFQNAIEKEMGITYERFANGIWVWDKLSKKKQIDISHALLAAVKKHKVLFDKLSSQQQQQLADAWDRLKKTGSECAWHAVGRRDDMSKYWTAAAFWDLIDKHYETSDECGDAFDSLHFLEAAGVFGVFLDKSPHASMLSLRDDLKAWWDDGGSLAEPFIDAIYRLNHMYDGGESN